MTKLEQICARRRKQDALDIKHLKRLKLPTLICTRCGWEWFPRSPELPKTCANKKCKSPYWNKPRRLRLQNAYAVDSKH